MTRRKALKTTIRARTRKTGERYSAARRQLLPTRARRRRKASAPPPQPKGHTAATCTRPTASRAGMAR